MIADVRSFLARGTGVRPFDVVFADPPYALTPRGRGGSGGRPAGQGGGGAAGSPGGGWCSWLLDTIAVKGVLAPDGVFVMEQAAEEDVQRRQGWALVTDRTYGRARIAVFRREGG